MARIRSVHPDITEDETLVDISDGAERTFVRLWTYLDDEGRGKDNVRLIKANIYPLSDDKTPEVVDAHLWELVEHGLLMRYVVDGQAVLCAKPTAWANYQKPQRPKASKLPAPPEDYSPPTPPPAPDDPKDTDDSPPRHESATRTRHDSDASATEHVRVHAVVGGGDRRQEGETETRAAPPRSTSLALVPANGTAPPARAQALPAASNHPPPPSGQYPADFEAWYIAYPRKRAKADAAKAWKRARGSATWDDIMTGLARSIAGWERENTPPDKIPYPASWLNGRRWEDEPDTQLATTGSKPAGYDGLHRVLSKRSDQRGTA